MKCTLLILCAVAICFSTYANATDFRTGVWTASLDDDDPGSLQISMVHGKGSKESGRGWNNMMGFNVALGSLTHAAIGRGDAVVRLGHVRAFLAALKAP